MKIIRKILCALSQHRLVHVVWLSDRSEMVACYDCHKRYAMNHSVRCILPWDRELENFYTDLAKLTEKPNAAE